MPTRQGGVSLLQDPLAQALLRSRVPARLAYVWPPGAPLVVPIAFHWTGEELVLGTPPGAPKVEALRQNPKVAVTIDAESFPAKVLLIRGTATGERADGLVPKYGEATKQYLGEAAAVWLEQMSPLLLHMGGMVRSGIRPERVGTLDFEQRFPSAVKRAVAAAQAGA
jgi:hypothetical protein